MPTSVTPLTRAFGETLREARQEARLSQERLGFRAHLSRNYISELELGRKAPSLPAIEALARALQTQPHTLVAAAEARVNAQGGR